jgi:hypothetical protein
MAQMEISFRQTSRHDDLSDCAICPVLCCVWLATVADMCRFDSMKERTFLSTPPHPDGFRDPPYWVLGSLPQASNCRGREGDLISTPPPWRDAKAQSIATVYFIFYKTWRDYGCK